MAIRMPRTVFTKKIIRQFSMTASHGAATASDVPKGYLAVYVGDQEQRRLVIPVSILNQPSFQGPLGQAEEEFGFDHPMGGLTIPCSVDIFTDLTSQLRAL